MTNAEAAPQAGPPEVCDEPPRHFAAGAAGEVLILSVDGFEGPLDGLLDLARAKKLDLTRLSIGALIDAFADAMAAALQQPNRPIGRWGEWLVMATHLTLLRSRRLLPADTEAARAAAHAAATLRRQLIERATVRAAADWLDQQTLLGRDVFARGRPETPATRRTGDLTELLRACLAALQMPAAPAAAVGPRPPPLWRVRDARARIEKQLATQPEGGPLAACLPRISDRPDRDRYCRAAVASTLIASLELARTGALTLSQPHLWAPIHLQPRQSRAGRPATDRAPAHRDRPPPSGNRH